MRKRFSSKKGLGVKAKYGVIVGIILVASFLAFSCWRIMQRRVGLDQRLQALKAELQVLKQRNEQLESGFSETLQSDYQEKVLREKGLYKKEGEKVVVILKPPSEQQQEQKPPSFWQKLLDKVTSFR